MLYKVYIYHDPGLTMTCFTARSNWVAYMFEWRKLLQSHLMGKTCSNNKLFLKNSFRNTIRMSNSWDPDQARLFVRPDLGPNCLPRLSADDTGRQRAKGVCSYLNKKKLSVTTLSQIQLKLMTTCLAGTPLLKLYYPKY